VEGSHHNTMKRTIKTMAVSRKRPVRETRTIARMLFPDDSSEVDSSDVTTLEVFESEVTETSLLSDLSDCTDDTLVVVELLLLSFDGEVEELEEQESVFSWYTEQSVPSSQTQMWPA